MNKYISMTILATSMLLTSCSDWLDVSPKTEERESEVFSSEEGYRQAISGVYVLLGQSSLYGLQASMYVPEFLAHTWTIPAESTDASAYYLARNDYSNSKVETTLDNLWSKYYNAIANVNNIIQHIDNTNVHFAGKRKQIMAGEMYGLRAFLHLDLMRFFGPVPENADGSKACIPYSKELTTDVAKLKTETYDEVKSDILADLDKAESLLAETDPYVTNAKCGDPGNNRSDASLEEDDLYRQLRFNYWAVLGTKARLYYWIGDKEKAVEYAEKVIAAKDASNTQIFTLCDENFFTKNSNGPLNMKSEHLFGAYNSNFTTEIFTPYYGKSSPLFSQKEEYVATAYESSLYPDDIRNKGTRYWATAQDDGSTTTSYHYYKYTNKGAVYGRYTVPLLRLSEMYFIVFEDAALSDMMSYFTTWRLARGLDSSIDATLTSESTVKARMEKEWRKEFMGEGQMFFFYKKHNTQTYTWPTTYELPTGAYVLPQPKSQSIYE